MRNNDVSIMTDQVQTNLKNTTVSDEIIVRDADHVRDKLDMVSMYVMMSLKDGKWYTGSSNDQVSNEMKVDA